ncbi:coniferyl aldehyde dehydrogenase, partial [Stenotrophomonas sp. HMWF023]
MSLSAADLPVILHTLRSAWQAQRPSLEQREADLRRLREALKERMDEMAAAIAEDFGHRAHVESKLADGMSVLSAIDHLRRHLRRWSKPRHA